MNYISKHDNLAPDLKQALENSLQNEDKIISRILRGEHWLMRQLYQDLLDCLATAFGNPDQKQSVTGIVEMLISETHQEAWIEFYFESLFEVSPNAEQVRGILIDKLSFLVVFLKNKNHLRFFSLLESIANKFQQIFPEMTFTSILTIFLESKPNFKFMKKTIKTEESKPTETPSQSVEFHRVIDYLVLSARKIALSFKSLWQNTVDWTGICPSVTSLLTQDGLSTIQKLDCAQIREIATILKKLFPSEHSRQMRYLQTSTSSHIQPGQNDLVDYGFWLLIGDAQIDFLTRNSKILNLLGNRIEQDNLFEFLEQPGGPEPALIRLMISNFALLCDDPRIYSFTPQIEQWDQACQFMCSRFGLDRPDRPFEKADYAILLKIVSFLSLKFVVRLVSHKSFAAESQLAKLLFSLLLSLFWEKYDEQYPVDSKAFSLDLVGLRERKDQNELALKKCVSKIDDQVQTKFDKFEVKGLCQEMRRYLKLMDLGAEVSAQLREKNRLSARQGDLERIEAIVCKLGSLRPKLPGEMLALLDEHKELTDLFVERFCALLLLLRKHFAPFKFFPNLAREDFLDLAAQKQLIRRGLGKMGLSQVKPRDNLVILNQLFVAMEPMYPNVNVDSANRLLRKVKRELNIKAKKTKKHKFAFSLHFEDNFSSVLKSISVSRPSEFGNKFAASYIKLDSQSWKNAEKMETMKSFLKRFLETDPINLGVICRTHLGDFPFAKERVSQLSAECDKVGPKQPLKLVFAKLLRDRIPKDWLGMLLYSKLRRLLRANIRLAPARDFLPRIHVTGLNEFAKQFNYFSLVDVVHECVTRIAGFKQTSAEIAQRVIKSFKKIIVDYLRSQDAQRELLIDENELARRIEAGLEPNADYQELLSSFVRLELDVFRELLQCPLRGAKHLKMGLVQRGFELSNAGSVAEMNDLKLTFAESFKILTSGDPVSGKLGNFGYSGEEVKISLTKQRVFKSYFANKFKNPKTKGQSTQKPAQQFRHVFFQIEPDWTDRLLFLLKHPETGLLEHAKTTRILKTLRDNLISELARFCKSLNRVAFPFLNAFPGLFTSIFAKGSWLTRALKGK